MPCILQRLILRLLLIATLLSFLFAVTTGCSKFSSKKRLHLGPFATDMIALAGDLQYGLGRLQPVHLQGYIHGPELEHFEALASKIRTILRGIIGYSIQVVTLGESELNGPERTEALANYLDGLLRPVLIGPLPPLQITVAELDTILSDVRLREDLLSGLRGSQPVVDEIARVAGELFDQTATTLEEVRAAIEAKVDADYAEVLKTDRKLRRLQLLAVQDIEFVMQARRGSQAAADSLCAHHPSLRNVLRIGEMPSEESMLEVEQRILFILGSIKDLRGQLSPDVNEYRQARRELGLLNNEYKAGLRQGSVAIIAWARAHDRLASGITDPAEIDVLGIARKAAGGAVPF
jgi:hypothetical protein